MIEWMKLGSKVKDHSLQQDRRRRYNLGDITGT